MKKRDRSPKRYAQALLATLTNEQAQAGLEQLDFFFSLLRDDQEAGTFFLDQELPAWRKTRALQEALEDFHPNVVNLLCLLAERGRLSQGEEIVSAFRLLLLERRGIVMARVSTAAPLRPEQEERLRLALEKRVGSPVHMETETEPGLLAGGKIRLGDLVIDGSLAAQLKSLGKHLHTHKENYHDHQG